MDVRYLVVISQDNNYDVGGLVRYFIKMFDDLDIRRIFNENNIKVITSKDIKENFKTTEELFIQNIDSKNYIFLGIHPYGLHKIYNNIKEGPNFIVWQNDPHYFAYYVDDRDETIQKYNKMYSSIFLDKIDYLITPSKIYFENLNIKKYDDKIIDFFYFINDEFFNEINYVNYKDRKSQVILSGTISDGYNSRMEFKNINNNLIYYLHHPGYTNNLHMTELNYYNELSKYKSAFVGHNNYPLNYLLAKHIEVLMCGCLAFFEPNTLLKEQLGLIEYKHYIPCFDKSGLIKDENFYVNWMNSKEGEEIANNGKEYVKKFGKDYIKELINFFNKI